MANPHSSFKVTTKRLHFRCERMAHGRRTVRLVVSPVRTRKVLAFTASIYTPTER